MDNDNYKIRMLKAAEVAKLLRINVNQANKLMQRKDFPALCDCGDKKVEETALFYWLQTRHDNNYHLQEDEDQLI